MASRDQNENRLFGVVFKALAKFLGAAERAVLRPFREWRGAPDPTGVYMEQSSWRDDMDSIMTTVGQIAMDAWSQATDVPPISRHAFVMSQLAQTENFLVRIPDEVYNLVFAELVDGTNAGEDVDQLASRVEQVLSTTGSEWWQGRARTIAQTETTRAYGAGVLGAGMEQSRLTGRRLRKMWRTEEDERVRASHRSVNGDVQELTMPFNVGGFPLLFPGDPMGPPDEVVGCRCDLQIVNERGA